MDVCLPSDDSAIADGVRNVSNSLYSPLLVLLINLASSTCLASVISRNHHVIQHGCQRNRQI